MVSRIKSRFCCSQKDEFPAYNKYMKGHKLNNKPK